MCSLFDFIISLTLTLPPMQLQIPVCLFSLLLLLHSPLLPSQHLSTLSTLLNLLALLLLPTASAFPPFLMSSRSALLPAMGSQLSRWHSHFHRRSISKARGGGEGKGESRASNMVASGWNTLTLSMRWADVWRKVQRAVKATMFDSLTFGQEQFSCVN